MLRYLGTEGVRVDVVTNFMRAKALASIRDATSSLSWGFSHVLTKEVGLNFTVSTPHHYLLQFTGNWGDAFKESTGALNV